MNHAQPQQVRLQSPGANDPGLGSDGEVPGSEGDFAGQYRPQKAGVPAHRNFAQHGPQLTADAAAVGQKSPPRAELMVAGMQNSEQ